MCKWVREERSSECNKEKLVIKNDYPTIYFRHIDHSVTYESSPSTHRGGIRSVQNLIMSKLLPLDLTKWFALTMKSHVHKSQYCWGNWIFFFFPSTSIWKYNISTFIDGNWKRMRHIRQLNIITHRPKKENSFFREISLSAQLLIQAHNSSNIT